MGVNTGPMFIGSFGCAGRLDYSPFGDGVNVASRLCGAAPSGNGIAIGEETRARAERERGRHGPPPEARGYRLVPRKPIVTGPSEHRLRIEAWNVEPLP